MNALTTRLTTLLGTRHALIQAPMAGVQDSRLALAVSGDGALGSLPAAMLPPDALRSQLQVLAASGLPYNVNFFAHTSPEPDDQRAAAWLEALAPYYAEFGLDQSDIPTGPGRLPFSAPIAELLGEFKPPVVSFHFGLPSPELLAKVKHWGACVLATATTVDEAVWLQEHGADAIIAQGLEAGGHRGMFIDVDTHTFSGHNTGLSKQISTLALVPQITAAVTLPVIATGGIADAAGVRAALALGAAGVQVGTAYLCAHEASTSALHRQALQSPAARHTALTNLFTGRPARGIMNRSMQELGSNESGMSSLAPAFPLAGNAIAPLRAAAEKQGRADFTPLWAGQNASQCKEASAHDITAALLQGFPDGAQ